MASSQCYKPCEQNNQPKTTTAHHDKCYDNKKNEYSLTEKVKEVTQKVFSHNDHHGSPTQKHATECSTGTAKAHRHDGDGGHGQNGHGGRGGHDEGHCMPMLRDHKKKMKKKTHKKDKRSGSSSSSESDSDNETCKKKC